MKIYKLTMGKMTCSFENLEQLLEDVKTMLEEEDVMLPLSIDMTEMTREEYEQIPEFEGW